MEEEKNEIKESELNEQNTRNLEDQNEIIIPAKYKFKMFFKRCGIISANLSYFVASALIVSLIGILMLPILYILNLFIAIIISIISLGLIYLNSGIKFMDLVIIDPNSLGTYMEVLKVAFPIALYILCGLSIVSLICMYIDKKNVHKARIVFAYIFIILSLLLIILTVTGGIKWGA